MKNKEKIEILKQNIKNTLKNININDDGGIFFASHLMIESTKMYVLFGGNLDEYYSLICKNK